MGRIVVGGVCHVAAGGPVIGLLLRTVPVCSTPCCWLACCIWRGSAGACCAASRRAPRQSIRGARPGKHQQVEKIGTRVRVKEILAARARHAPLFAVLGKSHSEVLRPSFFTIAAYPARAGHVVVKDGVLVVGTVVGQRNVFARNVATHGFIVRRAAHQQGSQHLFPGLKFGRVLCRHICA